MDYIYICDHLTFHVWHCTVLCIMLAQLTPQVASFHEDQAMMMFPRACGLTALILSVFVVPPGDAET